MTELRKPQEWAATYGLRIADPDGWRFGYGRYKPRSFDDEISHEEFLARLSPCTVGPLIDTGYRPS